MTPETIGAGVPARPPRHPRGHARRLATLAVAALLASFLPILAPSVAGAEDHAEPRHVQFTLEGCRGSVGSFEGGTELSDFVCADHEYTTGNLGPGWNELDLVPHRLTTTTGTQTNVSETFQVNISADSVESGRTGYEYISEPVLNKDLSDPSCVDADPGQQQPKTPGIGGTDTTIYRTLTITQLPGTTCVYDYVQLLAIGASKYPGASLHSNLTQADFTVGGIGARDVSIPVKQIQPQELDKDMTATQGASHVWNVIKSPSPASLNFADTCSSDPDALQQSVQITVEWQRLPANPDGPITIVTNITLTNPAHRTITAQVTDVIYAGDTVVDVEDFDAVPVPANGTYTLTHTLELSEDQVPDGTTSFSDVATATYTDPIRGGAVLGSLQDDASATVKQSSDSAANGTATITDVEDIVGEGLTYSVDSFEPSNTGLFDDDYAPGTKTSGEVSWTSFSQSSSGSVTFYKTVYLDEPRSTSGTLSDTATVRNSDLEALASDSATVNIDSDATVTLEIQKVISGGLLDEDASFTFDVTGPDGFDEQVTLTVPAGQTTAVIDVGDELDVALAPGVYTLNEQDPGPGWAFDEDPRVVDLTLPTCELQTTFTNSFLPATATAVKNVVSQDVEASPAGWEVCLYESGDPSPIECGVTGADGTYDFDFSDFEDGTTYEIRETHQPGWDQTASGAECTFAPDFPADGGRAFVCTFENTERGTVTVIKTSSGFIPPDGAFAFQIREDASATEPGAVLASDTNDATGTVDFDSLIDGLPPGAYQLCETDMLPGWHSSLSDEPGAFVPDSDAGDVDNSVICVAFTLEPGEDQVFNVVNTPPPGGDARTIGYWRNWSWCSGGNQEDVLDQTLASAGGILIGDLPVGTCEEAVAILSKSDLDGNKRASDPAYNLAAQLLAALLNVEADAGVCQAATDAMIEAQALLGDADFDGETVYGGSSTKGKAKKSGDTATVDFDGARANELAAILDAYNNNELC